MICVGMYSLTSFGAQSLRCQLGTRVSSNFFERRLRYLSSTRQALERKTKNIVQDCLRIGFLGGGRMGGALCNSIVRSNVLQSGSTIVVSDINEKCLENIEKEGKSILWQQLMSDEKNKNENKNVSLITTNDNRELVGSDIVIIGVKPQIAKSVLTEMKDYWTGNELIVSIMAGVTTKEIESYFAWSMEQRVIRVMPNTPALVDSMASGMCKGKNATENDILLVQNLLSKFGVCKIVEKEELIDSVTGLSGSGPAYVYMFIESLCEAGIKCGLSKQDSLELATETVLGAAKMVKQSGKNPSELKNQVTSPGGTTMEGINALEDGNFKDCVINAVEKATQKATFLGRQ